MRVAMIAFTQRIEMAKHLVKIAHFIGMLGLCGLAAGQMERVGRDDPLPLDQPHALTGAVPAAAPGKVERTELGYGVARAQPPHLMCGAGSDPGEPCQGLECL